MSKCDTALKIYILKPPPYSLTTTTFLTTVNFCFDIGKDAF